MSVSDNTLYTVSGNVPDSDGTSSETDTILSRILELLEEYFNGLKKSESEAQEQEQAVMNDSISSNSVSENEYQQAVTESLADISMQLEAFSVSGNSDSVSDNTVSGNLPDNSFYDSVTAYMEESLEYQKNTYSVSTVTLCTLGIMTGILIAFTLVRWFRNG